jgi:hypothetical protein
MRILKSAAVALGLALVALPAGAAIKAMTLTELMGITTDVVHGKILDSSTFRLDYPFEGAVWTKLTVEGDSMRTLAPVKTDVVFLGSHVASDRFTVSEMPTLQDARVGNEAVIFYFTDPQMPGASNNVVFALDSIYRVETAFGAPVVVGKGEGFAFPENVKLDDARAQVRAAHLELAKKAAK